MTTTQARQTVKAINRWVRKTKPFEGGRQYGVDYPTWRVTFPQTSAIFEQAAEVLTGRKGNFMPRF